MRNVEKHLCCREPFSRRPLMPPLHASEQRFCITLEASVSITCYSCGNPLHYWELKPLPSPFSSSSFAYNFGYISNVDKLGPCIIDLNKTYCWRGKLPTLILTGGGGPNLIKLSAHSHLPENLEIMQWVKILANHS